MKCIKYMDGKISRVTDSKAEMLVDAKKAVYIPKSLWKAEVRNIEVTQEIVTNEAQIPVEEVKKPKKRKEKKTKKELKSEKNKQKKLEKEQQK